MCCPWSYGRPPPVALPALSCHPERSERPTHFCPCSPVELRASPPVALPALSCHPERSEGLCVARGATGVPARSPSPPSLVILSAAKDPCILDGYGTNNNFPVVLRPSRSRCACCASDNL